MKKTNHVLHLILTLLTGGLWLFVWIPLVISRRNKNRTPRLEPLNYTGTLDVVGESNFTANISAIRRAADIDPEEELITDAWLVAEPTNPHDPNAVAVAVPVNGQAHVAGYLPRAVAESVSPIITAAHKRGVVPTISIEISEAFQGSEGKKIYSVRVARG